MSNVLIDGYNLGLERGTGVATYARNLSHELKALGHQVSVLYGNRAAPSREALLREIAFFDSNVGERDRFLEILDQMHRALVGPLGHFATSVPISGQVITRAFSARLPAYDHILNAADVFKRSQSAFKLWGSMSTVAVPKRPDLVHWTYPVPLHIKRAPNVYTMHDLVPLRLPYTTLDKKRTYLKLMRHIAKCADHIVTVSECSRHDIIKMLGISPNRVTNTYQSVSIPDRYANKEERLVAQEVEGATGVGYKNYFLFWGSIEPKKNIGRMIEAYLASGVDTPLVILGAQAWKSEQELRILDDDVIRFLTVADGQIRTKKRVIQLSYAPFSLLVSLIRGAKAALFPSLYEGFGLPALEAMLLGTPVICSNTASLPEVVGDAAVMIDPYDTAALSAAIWTVDRDADLRAELASRGVREAARFSPEIYREKLRALYSRFV
ncbi:glycosyltransferase family 4 protein [Polymorphobacter fuscus]|uniref:Glycosyltransferase n=1 Tax=Sandarakinorhabdus fusca TaxID=1439888 RepID=A0A7C9KGW0_9SPHN|nr:glycosyltransferase family 1 protein [Polymorphobacter fuscus]KAB7648365.1 glycosyltransferase family 4 protein [Polymorphobacter fuscus]MQT15879.1 glycosyltransferase [Polymorphobacter fuscus]NJC07848.1 glycosyltransferase involved in cell wall biosynthesis [Polymorphobacter fuscus]